MIESTKNTRTHTHIRTYTQNLKMKEYNNKKTKKIFDECMHFMQPIAKNRNKNQKFEPILILCENFSKYVVIVISQAKKKIFKEYV